MATMAAVTLLTFVFALLVCENVYGHAILREPKSRASGWRDLEGLLPENKDDFMKSCGGFVVHSSNNGQCGVCGDPWHKTPRPHERGGKYYTGKILTHYQMGSEITVIVQISQHRGGYFEFSICPVSNHHEEVSSECLASHPLYEARTGKRRLTADRLNGLHNRVLKLPNGLWCEHCVIRWRYVGDDVIGVCPGNEKFTQSGCGIQNEYRACADVRISPGRSLHPPPIREIEEDNFPMALNLTLIKGDSMSELTQTFYSVPDSLRPKPKPAPKATPPLPTTKISIPFSNFYFKEGHDAPKPQFRETFFEPERNLDEFIRTITDPTSVPTGSKVEGYLPLPRTPPPGAEYSMAPYLPEYNASVEYFTAIPPRPIVNSTIMSVKRSLSREGECVPTKFALLHKKDNYWVWCHNNCYHIPSHCPPAYCNCEV